MTMYSAITTIAGQAAAEALAERLDDLEPAPFGTGVFEIEDGSGLYEVGAHFEEAPDGIALALLAASAGARPWAVSEVPDVDWVAHVRRELAPVEAGRFHVYGSHDADSVPEGRIALLIEAAMAFGTGHHGTTLGCLRALDRMIEDGMVKARVADIGCGTAVLAMAAAHVWPGTVLASDIDPVAVDVARANVAANGLEGRVVCVEAAGFDAPALRRAAPYDLVFANILKGPLLALAPEMAAMVAPGGHVILSGILNEQAVEVQEVYTRAGFNPVWHDEIVEWSILTMIRVS
ncbi:MAG: 50S ribosomal protein L11 methyltransferase [Rhodobacterales bacterium]|nr:50S ribosomal protein L11 methyltransferase [Rhodobacterales bacterium]NCT13026.1 50S ribosomal protein L11 methyltransferase [Rhodobacterales bacterium]